MFILAKFSAIMPVILQVISHLPYFPWHLGWCDVNRNDPICVALPKVAKESTVPDCRVSLLPMVLLTNVANVNDPLAFVLLGNTGCARWRNTMAV